MVDVAVVGVGDVGARLAAEWHRVGCEVALVTLDLDSSTTISLAAAHGLRRMLVRDALAEARVVVLADPVDDVDTLFGGCDGLDVRAVVIDASDLAAAALGNVTALRSHTRGACVYRAFDTAGWIDAVGADGDRNGEARRIFYAGPDDEGRDTVEGCFGQLGMRMVYVGGSECIDVVDALSRVRLEVLAARI